MLNYFEHVFIPYIGWQMEKPVNYVEDASVLEPETVSWTGCPELLELRGKSKREAILSFVHCCERLSCNGWAEPQSLIL